MGEQGSGAGHIEGLRLKSVSAWQGLDLRVRRRNDRISANKKAAHPLSKYSRNQPMRATARASVAFQGQLADIPHALVDACLDALDAQSQTAPYYELAEPAKAWFAGMAARYGPQRAEEFARAVLRRAIEGRRYMRRLVRLPASVRYLAMEQHERIIRNLTDKPYGFYEPSKDMFLKDLGLARLTLVPAGAQLVDLTRGPSKRLMLSADSSQVLRFLRLYLRLPLGLAPLFEIHTHDEMLGDFNEPGWERCYARIAELLSVNPRVKGIYGSSWFYDPAIATISPRLKYLHSTPAANGAYFFHIGPDESGNAIATSRTRRELYRTGQYVPQKYLMVWHRKDILRWAAQLPRQRP